jgi:hypothetical protein
LVCECDAALLKEFFLLVGEVGLEVNEISKVYIFGLIYRVMRNNKAVVLSLIALVFMVLTFSVHWMFIALAAFFSWLGWRELFKKGKK